MSETLADYEKFLESLQLYPDLFKIKSVEMDLKGERNPSFILEDLFFKQQRWLSFADFYKYYSEKFGEAIKKEFGFTNDAEFSEGLRARLYRTQFGFLTEYHAYFLSCFLFGEQNVIRSSALDVAGVDFQIKIENADYNIHIFVDSQRAWEYRNFKSQHKQVNNWQGIHVNLPYSLKSGWFNSLRFLKNRFGVYTEKYLRYFEAEVKASRIKNNNIKGASTTGFIYS